MKPDDYAKLPDDDLGRRIAATLGEGVTCAFRGIGTCPQCGGELGGIFPFWSDGHIPAPAKGSWAEMADRLLGSMDEQQRLGLLVANGSTYIAYIQTPARKRCCLLLAAIEGDLK